jgi:feruloyl esterase
MISFHGWNDEIVPAQSTIDYYQSVQRYMGAGTAAKFYKPSMASGMNHCRGGVGPDSFGFWGEDEDSNPNPGNDLLEAMIAWVEKGIEPGRIVATKYEQGKAVMTRPVCQWPQSLKYTGKGDARFAESWSCVAPR